MPSPKKKQPEADPQSCGSCKFFLKNQHDDAGYCRRYPPTVVPVSDGDQFSCEFPVVEAPDWCGEWQRKLQS